MFKAEVRLFQEFMTEENFKEWYNDVPQYQFDEGQEPKAMHFTAVKTPNIKDK